MTHASTTLIVEPHPGGHRFQSVSTVTALARKAGPVVLLTSKGARENPSFASYISDDVARGDLVVHEEFDGVVPATADQARIVGRFCHDLATTNPVRTVVLMDADQALKRWWFAAPRHLRGLRPKPRIIFFLTRYPARLGATDMTGWKLRVPKAALAIAAMATRSLHRVAGYAGRDDVSSGWIVKRVRDPEYCSAHSRDRAQWRSELGLPAYRTIVGIFGVLTGRKNAPLVLEAIKASGLEADLLLAGQLDDEVRAWVDGLDADDRDRVLVRDEYLSNETLDRLVASVDVVPLALTNNGPSGIMGKAAAAGVPVVSAGSKVRAREVVATEAGEAADFDAVSIGAAMRRLVERASSPRDSAPRVPEQEYAMRLLGVDDDASPRRRRGLAG